MKNTDVILYNFLVESHVYNLSEFQSINEEDKPYAIKTIASELFKEISNSLATLDTTPIDRTRGDIRQLRELDAIQAAMNQIDLLIDQAKNIDPLIRDYASTIVKSIFYLNSNSAVFKEAYRMKKNVLILRYQTVVMAIMSSIAYLFSSITDYSTGQLTLKLNAKVTEISAYRTLKDFIRSIDSNEFKILVKDTNTLREFVNENDNVVMASILEANDILDTVKSGLMNLYNGIDRGGKTTNVVYKAVGVLMILMQAREILAMLNRSRYTLQDTIDGIKNFAACSGHNVAGGVKASLNKLHQFCSRYKADVEENSQIAIRDVESQAREVSNNIKALPEPELEINEPAPVATPQPRQLIRKQPEPAQPAPAVDNSADLFW